MTTPHVPPRFREDNTEGYTTQQLAELNRRFDNVVADNAPQWTEDAQLDELAFKSWLDHVAEQVLAEFDAA